MLIVNAEWGNSGVAVVKFNNDAQKVERGIDLSLNVKW